MPDASAADRSWLFPDGVFDPLRIGDGRTAEVLDAAAKRFNVRLCGSDVIWAAVQGCIAGSDLRIRDPLELALADGVRLQDVCAVIDAYNPVGGDSYEFDGAPGRFGDELLEALDEFEAEFRADSDRLRPVCLELLLACVLAHPDGQDLRFLTEVLDFGQAVESLRRRVLLHTDAPPELWDPDSGRLRSEEFTADAWAVLERAAQRAADLGYDRVLTPHCLLALLAESEGQADRMVRRQLPPQVGVVRAVEIVTDAFRLSERAREAVPTLHRDEIGAGLHDRLRAARAEATAWGAGQTDVAHLLAAVLAEPPERLASVLQGAPLNLDLKRLREHLREAMLESRGAAPRDVPYKLPGHLPPAEDLTWLARTGEVSAARHLDRYFDPLFRALHRTKDHHILVTALPGVGSTTLLRDLARLAALGGVPELHRKRLIRVDCRDVAPEASQDQLSGLIGQVGGRTDVVLCVDGLGPLLRGPRGGRHNLILRSALKEGRIHLIAVLTDHDYDDLVSDDHELQELTTRIELVEPGKDAALEMVRQAADELAGRFHVQIDDAAVARAVVLARDFLPRHRLPSSAVRALHRACENFDYVRSRQVHEGGADTGANANASVIGAEEAVLAVAELSGVPAGQLGSSVQENTDYAALLRTRVVGQDGAVRTAAAELRRIKSGLASVSSGPATVMLFAGLTGVGKTELAKAVADVYSASKRLRTYPMENFTEPHSVSGFLGAPPGYSGHEQGGRLINELNADPYSVFLLDEAEKAHPEVLRPFLNLFDEGWTVDQRGVKAYADRAIFILTSNAGHRVIREMSGYASTEEIEAAVRKQLAAERTQRGEVVFTPELLARIRQIVVFRPLTLEAMVGICRIKLDIRCTHWREKQEKHLEIAPEVVEYVAHLGYRRNEDAGGAEGGRIIDKLIADLVENPVLAATEERREEYRGCDRVEVGLDPITGGTTVRFGAAPEAAR